MKKQFFAIGLIFWALALPIRAQEPILKTAQIQDVSLYVEMFKSTYSSDDLFEKLGDLHYFNNDHKEASKWYQELYESKNGMMSPEYLLKYSTSLKTVGNEILAAKIYGEFINVSGNIIVAFSSFLNDQESNKENISGSNDEFLPIPEQGNDGLVENEFEDAPSYGDHGGRRRRVSGTKNNQKNTSNRDNTSVNLHESSVVITKDGNTMYFTRAQNIDYGESGQAQLRIYRSKKINGTWGKVEDLAINGNAYSNAHPVLSLDEKTLYFSSDMPSSYGETDIYAVSIKDNGFLGKPRNLGPKVNTKSNESFPYVSSDDGLYFSSNGHYGNGGFDVYYVDLKSEDKQLMNLGNPINGPHDDFAFPSFGRFGIKSESHGLNDTKLIQDFYQMRITMTILDIETGKPIKEARVVLMDDNEIEKVVVRTNREGVCTFNINRFKDYLVKVEKNEYRDSYKYIAKGNNKRGLDIKLKRSKL